MFALGFHDIQGRRLPKKLGYLEKKCFFLAKAKSKWFRYWKIKEHDMNMTHLVKEPYPHVVLEGSCFHKFLSWLNHDCWIGGSAAFWKRSGRGGTFWRKSNGCVTLQDLHVLNNFTIPIFLCVANMKQIAHSVWSLHLDKQIHDAPSPIGSDRISMN